MLRYPRPDVCAINRSCLLAWRCDKNWLSTTFTCRFSSPPVSGRWERNVDPRKPQWVSTRQNGWLIIHYLMYVTAHSVINKTVQNLHVRLCDIHASQLVRNSSIPPSIDAIGCHSTSAAVVRQRALHVGACCHCMFFIIAHVTYSSDCTDLLARPINIVVACTTCRAALF